MTFKMSKKTLSILFLLLAFAVVSRGYFAHNLPLSGDEVGVGVLQATGQALSYEESLPAGNVPISKIKKYIDYSADKGVQDVFHSLRYWGMHPPFYYLLLRYTIQFFNNRVTTLRALSILFSVLSVVLIFLLGKAIHGEFLGLLSAGFVTLSAYCLQYGVMVRPYPLVMFLSLFSTLLIFSLVTKSKFHFKSLGCYLYILTSAIGLYSLYHYIFVVFFQAVFTILSLRKHVKSMLLTALVFLPIALLFVPWLPYLKDQLATVNSGDYYFRGQNNPLVIFFVVIRNNFLRFPFQDDSLGLVLFVAKIVAFVIVLLVFSIGCRNMLYHEQSRPFFIALLLYLAAHFAADWIMQSRTFNFKHFQFFVGPMFFFVLAFGLVEMSDRSFLRSALVLLLSTLLVLSSQTVLQAKINFDGPAIVKTLASKISDHLTNRDDSALLIVNTSARRFLFPIVHSIDLPIDVVVFTGGNIAATLATINSVTQYDIVFVANLLVPYERESHLYLIEKFLGQGKLTHRNLLLGTSEGTVMQFTKSTDIQGEPTQQLRQP